MYLTRSSCPEGSSWCGAGGSEREAGVGPGSQAGGSGSQAGAPGRNEPRLPSPHRAAERRVVLLDVVSPYLC